MTDIAPEVLDKATLEAEEVRIFSADDLGRAEIENQLDTTGVLSHEWRAELIKTSLWRIELRMRSAGTAACEMNDLSSRKLALLGQRDLTIPSPVPTFGQHPAHSRPGRPVVNAFTDTEGSGD